MGKIWGYITAAFALLVGAFLYEKNKKEDAEAKLDNADTKKEDATLSQHTTDLRDQDEKDRLEVEAQKIKDPTPEELLDFLNKDKK